METTDCDSHHEVLCQSYNLSRTAHLNFLDRDTSSYTVAIVILALLLSLVILTAVVILFLSCRIRLYPFSEEWRKESASEIRALASCHKKRITSCAREQEEDAVMLSSKNEIIPQEDNEVQEGAKDSDVKSATDVKAMSSEQVPSCGTMIIFVGSGPAAILKVIRIIMFSSGVDSILPNHKNSNVTNIVWEPSENMERFNGNEEASTVAQTFESLTGHSLSVINIITPFSAKDNCINLDENKENQLIAFLDNNCGQNLVIFLPLLRLKFCNLDNLKKILSLRRKAVVVTIAQMMPKFPTTEIITAIGEITDEEQCKVADITVPVKQNGKSKSKIEKEGAAKVVGLAAALLHAGCNQISGVVDLSSFVWRAMVAYMGMHPKLFKSSQLNCIKADDISTIMKRVTEDQEQTFPVKIDRSGTHSTVMVNQIMKIAFILDKKQYKWSALKKKDAKLVGDYFRWKSDKPVGLKDVLLPVEVNLFKEDMISNIKDAYKYIHLSVYEINTEDVNCLTHLSEILNKVKECSIVYQTCVDMDVPDDHPVMKSAFYLQKHSVLVSAAKARISDLTPQFPSTLSIAVGANETKAKEQQLLGSTLDFVCKEQRMENAAVSVVVLIVFFLREAISQKELSENRLNSICTTPVMQRILREMCSHPEHHDSTEGWGVLNVQNAIQTKIRDHHKLRRLISVDPKTIFWNGKNM